MRTASLDRLRDELLEGQLDGFKDILTEYVATRLCLHSEGPPTNGMTGDKMPDNLEENLAHQMVLGFDADLASS